MNSGRLLAAGEVDEAGVALQRGLVAEPLGLLVGVDVAADPGEQRAEVDGVALVGVEADPLGQPERDHRLAQHVLHRLAHAEVDAEGEHAEQLGQPQRGGALDGAHRGNPRRPPRRPARRRSAVKSRR